MCSPSETAGPKKVRSPPRYCPQVNAFPSERHIQKKEDDRLGFYPYAEALADLVTAIEPPQVIGVTGSWGSGKTSLMSLCMGALTESTTIHSVWFDAWQYDKGINLLYPLVRRVSQSCSNTQIQSEDIHMKRVLATVALLGYDVVTGILNKATGIDLGTKKLADTLKLVEDNGPLLERYVDDVSKLRGEVDEFFLGIRSATGKEKICIFVDDLDRCSPDTCIDLLENIRLHFDVPGVVFVLAVSKNAIDDALAKRYGSSSVYNDSFLEKLVHIEFPVPASSPASIEPVILNILGKSPLLKPLLEGSELSGQGTPRFVKRIAKRLVVLSSTFKRVEKKDLTEAHVYLTVLRYAYPLFFKEYLRSPEAAVLLRDSYTHKFRNDSREAYVEGLGSKYPVPHAFLEKFCQLTLDHPGGQNAALYGNELRTTLIGFARHLG